MKLVICVPGNTFSLDFMKAWTAIISNQTYLDIEIIPILGYSPNIYFSRMSLLGGNNKGGKNQTLFNGIDYDYILWIDSDIYFSIPQMNRVREHMEAGIELISGWYVSQLGSPLVVEKWDMDYLNETGMFKYMNIVDLSQRSEIFEIAYAGLGFTLVKQGVFEKIGFPWFHPVQFDVNERPILFSEDVSFFYKAQQAGVTALLDPRLHVGHIKPRILTKTTFIM